MDCGRKRAARQTRSLGLCRSWSRDSPRSREPRQRLWGQKPSGRESGVVRLKTFENEEDLHEVENLCLWEYPVFF